MTTDKEIRDIAFVGIIILVMVLMSCGNRQKTMEIEDIVKIEDTVEIEDIMKIEDTVEIEDTVKKITVESLDSNRQTWEEWEEMYLEARKRGIIIEPTEDLINEYIKQTEEKKGTQQ